MFTSRISGVFIVLLVLAVAIVMNSFVTRSAAIPIADRSYDNIEQVRTLPDGPSGYEQVEALRIQRGAVHFIADSSYDRVEQVRLERTRNVDHSYDSIEAIRLEA